MSQSGEEDTELRDLLKQTLEENGVLSKLRAQLRACVFLALDDNNDKEYKKPMLNKKVTKHQLTAEGQLIFCLVREFLEYFNLDTTLSVFDPESYCGTGYKYEGRSRLMEKLGLNSDLHNDVPLLLELLHLVKVNNINSQTASKEDILHNLQPIKSIQKKETNLNETFDVSTPTINIDQLATKDEPENEKSNLEIILSPRTIDESDDSKESIKTENTFEDASSIAEDFDKTDPLIDLNKTAHASDNQQFDTVGIKTLIDESIVEPEPKESRSSSSPLGEKLKLSPHKSDKLKGKTNLNLSDLPPLHLNKSRDTVLLPSLYTKEFKEKSNLKEIDKLLDLDMDSLDNYEEDFMSGSELELSQMHNKGLMPGENVKFNAINTELSLKTDSSEVLSKISVKHLENTKKESTESSITEDLEINSKLEDD